MSEQQKQLQSLSDEFQSLKTELQTTVSARQKLESQQQENLGVQKEFATLSDDANVYKLVGPVLLKQDTSEARSTVDGRLEFIEKEMRRMQTVPEHFDSSDLRTTPYAHLPRPSDYSIRTGGVLSRAKGQPPKIDGGYPTPWIEM
ncbi:hypothetical protein B0A49_09655 [Cryomyces minteri]|uniref:Prefoldin subunit 6 n=1 Tax=Cryomyces minteri TaxID=331657 RepID=A0A4V6WKV7_9PEZI|nr:hypothetical protein B0A49_09655 [Cryomyces minteri]